MLALRYTDLVTDAILGLRKISRRHDRAATKRRDCSHERISRKRAPTESRRFTRTRNMRLPSPRSSATPPARAPFLETNVCAVCDGLCRPTRARGSSAVGSTGTRSRENWALTQLQLCASSRLCLYTAPSRKRETAAREREGGRGKKKETSLLMHPVPRLAPVPLHVRQTTTTSDERRATSDYLCLRIRISLYAHETPRTQSKCQKRMTAHALARPASLISEEHSHSHSQIATRPSRFARSKFVTSRLIIPISSRRSWDCFILVIHRKLTKDGHECSRALQASSGT